MRDGSMTQTRAKAAARGLMRNSDGADGRVAEGWNDETAEAWTGWATMRGMAADGALGTARPTSWGLAAGAGAGAVASGMASPGWPRKPTVLCTGTLTPGLDRKSVVYGVRV